MANPFKTPQFKRLFKEWNRRLEKAGHKEIEDFTKPVPVLFDWESTRWTRRAHFERNGYSGEYFEKAENLLNTFTFQTPKHRQAWELYCRGISIRKIAEAIKEPTTTTFRIISGVERESGLKPCQTKSK